MKPYDVIYLDMDGVVCDFYLEATRAHLRVGKSYKWLNHHGTPLELGPRHFLEHYPAGQSLHKVLMQGKPDDNKFSEFWRPLLIEPSTWTWMRAYDYAEGFINSLHDYADHVVFVSHAHSGTAQEHAGKREWAINNGFSDIELIICANKWRLADGPRSVLIDDFHENVSKFINPPKQYNKTQGGDAFMFPRPWNSEHANYKRACQLTYEYLSRKA